ncbi:hypothetical protein MMC13_004902 [Lambiella insularis]|nr:hypothetical protein [Lambiella insularis]
MRNRARPAALFSLMGIASRVAERMGLHRDGDGLGTSVLRSEESRRIWWQLEHMEIFVAKLTGCYTLTIYSDWDTKLPRNLEDHDLNPDTQVLPPARHGLTIMSHCLWQYQILYLQRVATDSDGERRTLPWLLSKSVPLAEKDAKIDTVEKCLGEKFLQHCEPMNPLHVHIQIGVRAFILAARSAARQPALVNAKVLEMSQLEREDLLRVSTKSLEYYILSETTESLRGFQWYNEIYFAWPAFAYIILEAYHRYNDDIVMNLWSLIGRIYAIHPMMTSALQRPDIASIVQLTLVAWQRRQTFAQQRSQQRYDANSLNECQPPSWILELRRKLDLPEVNLIPKPDSAMGESVADEIPLLPLDFDFDSIDWSFWENQYLGTASFEADL